jgi:hypothetical protein
VLLGFSKELDRLEACPTTRRHFCRDFVPGGSSCVALPGAVRIFGQDRADGFNPLGLSHEVIRLDFAGGRPQGLALGGWN